MKFLSIPQMAFGLLLAYFSWQLVDMKAHTPPVSGDGTLWLTTPPPSTELELTILFIGSAVFICGLAQREFHVKLGSIQMVFGLVSVGISAFLYGRANVLQYGEYSTVYELAYLPMVFGLAVFGVGVAQFRGAGKGNSETKPVG